MQFFHFIKVLSLLVSLIPTHSLLSSGKGFENKLSTTPRAKIDRICDVICRTGCPDLSYIKLNGKMYTASHNLLRSSILLCSHEEF